MKIENYEKQQFLEILFKYKIESYITYNVEGRSGFFSGKSTFCIREKDLDNFINKINEIHIFEEIRINDNDSDSFISITLNDNLGHYNIICQIGGTHQDNYCKISINTDYNGICNFFLLN